MRNPEIEILKMSDSDLDRVRGSNTKVAEFAGRIYLKNHPEELDGWQIIHHSYLAIAASTGKSWEVLEAAWEKDGRSLDVWTKRDDFKECVEGGIEYQGLFSPLDYLIANGDVAPLHELKKLNINFSADTVTRSRDNRGLIHWMAINASGITLDSGLKESFNNKSAESVRDYFLASLSPLKLALLSGNQDMISFVVENIDPFLLGLSDPNRPISLFAQLALCNIDANWFWKQVLKKPAREGIKISAKDPIYVVTQIYPFYCASTDSSANFLETQSKLGSDEEGLMRLICPQGKDALSAQLNELQELKVNSLAKLINMDSQQLDSHLRGLRTGLERFDLVSRFWNESPRCFYHRLGKGQDQVAIEPGHVACRGKYLYEERDGEVFQLTSFAHEFKNAPIDQDIQSAKNIMALFATDFERVLPAYHHAFFESQILRNEQKLGINQKAKAACSEYFIKLINQDPSFEAAYFKTMAKEAFCPNSKLMLSEHQQVVKSKIFDWLLSGRIKYRVFQELSIPDQDLVSAIASHEGDDCFKLKQYLVLHRVYQKLKDQPQAIQSYRIDGQKLVIEPSPGQLEFSPHAFLNGSIKVLDDQQNELSDTPLVERALLLFQQESCMTFADLANPYFQGLATKIGLQSMTWDSAIIRGAVYAHLVPGLSAKFKDGMLDQQTLSKIQIDDQDMQLARERQQRFEKCKKFKAAYSKVSNQGPKNIQALRAQIQADLPEKNEREVDWLMQFLRGGAVNDPKSASENISKFYDVSPSHLDETDQQIEERLKCDQFFKKNRFKRDDFDTTSPVPLPEEFVAAFERDDRTALYQLGVQFMQECQTKCVTWNLRSFQEFVASLSPEHLADLTLKINVDHPWAELYRKLTITWPKNQQLASALLLNNHLIFHQDQVDMMKGVNPDKEVLQCLKVDAVYHTSWVNDVFGVSYFHDLPFGNYEGLMAYELLRAPGAKSAEAPFKQLFAKLPKGEKLSLRLWKLLAQNNRDLFLQQVGMNQNVEVLLGDQSIASEFLRSQPSSSEQQELLALCLKHPNILQKLPRMNIDLGSQKALMDQCLENHYFNSFNILWERGFRDFSAQTVQRLVQATSHRSLDFQAYKKTMGILLWSYFKKAHGKSYLVFTLATVSIGLGIALAASTLVPAILFSALSQGVFAMRMYNDDVMHHLMWPKVSDDKPRQPPPPVPGPVLPLGHSSSSDTRVLENAIGARPS